MDSTTARVWSVNAQRWKRRPGRSTIVMTFPYLSTNCWQNGGKNLKTIKLCQREVGATRPPDMRKIRIGMEDFTSVTLSCHGRHCSLLIVFAMSEMINKFTSSGLDFCPLQNLTTWIVKARRSSASTCIPADVVTMGISLQRATTCCRRRGVFTSWCRLTSKLCQRIPSVEFTPGRAVHPDIVAHRKLRRRCFHLLVLLKRYP